MIGTDGVLKVLGGRAKRQSRITGSPQAAKSTAKRQVGIAEHARIGSRLNRRSEQMDGPGCVHRGSISPRRGKLDRRSVRQKPGKVVGAISSGSNGGFVDRDGLIRKRKSRGQTSSGHGNKRTLGREYRKSVVSCGESRVQPRFDKIEDRRCSRGVLLRNRNSPAFKQSNI